MSFDYVFQGPPGAVATPGTPLSPADAIDTVNNVLYVSAGSGWRPLASTVAGGGAATGAGTGNLTGLVADNANVLTFAVPSQLGGSYLVTIYESSTNTPTGATLPAVTATYKEKDTTSTQTAVLASVGSVSAAGVTNKGTLVLNAQGGQNIVVSTSGYAAGSVTALAYNIHVRIVFLG